jgi:SM-20-related protein
MTNFVGIRNFLLTEERGAILEYFCDMKESFKTSGVISGSNGLSQINTEYRRSRVLFNLGPYRGLLTRRIESYFPWVLHKLGAPFFQHGRLEIQVTSSGDEEFFKRHSDNLYSASKDREITFVYFIKRLNSSFVGGELILHPDSTGDSTQSTEIKLRPVDNSIVFFPSGIPHEVALVRCPSKKFEDSRITINGWFRR